MSRVESSDIAEQFSYDKLNRIADSFRKTYQKIVGDYLVSYNPRDAFIHFEKINGAFSELHKEANTDYGIHAKSVQDHSPILREKY